jgi:hypothetical protein
MDRLQQNDNVEKEAAVLDVEQVTLQLISRV